MHIQTQYFLARLLHGVKPYGSLCSTQHACGLGLTGLRLDEKPQF